MIGRVNDGVNLECRDIKELGAETHRSRRASYRSTSSSGSGTHNRPLNWIDPADGTTFRVTRPDVRSRPVAPSYAPVPPVTPSRQLGRRHAGSGHGRSRSSSDG